MRTVRAWTMACAGLLAVGLAVPAWAADLQVFSTIGMQSALQALAPAFESATGDQLRFTWGTSAQLIKRLQAGETADLAVLTRQDLDTLVRDDKVTEEPDSDIASSLIAVVVKHGAPKPDISTPEAFRQTLLKAKAIALSDPAAGGASGIYVAGLLERMGLGQQLKSKIRHPPPGGNSATLVVDGQADLAIQQKPELLSVPGVDLVGPLPAELQKITMFSAGIGTGGHERHATALIRFLHSPQANGVYEAKGLTPLSK